MSQEIERVAVIGGTGNQGFGLALRFAEAGRAVVVGSRSVEKAERHAEEIGEIVPGARVVGYENERAASEARLVVLTVPYSAQADILEEIEPGLGEGNVLVDVTVPLRWVEGSPIIIEDVPGGSAAQRAAELVPEGVEVASAFHTVSSELLRDLESPLDCDVLVCAESQEAKDQVVELAEEMPGVRGLDAGGLRNSSILEELAVLLLEMNKRYGSNVAGVRVTGILGEDST